MNKQDISHLLVIILLVGTAVAKDIQSRGHLSPLDVVFVALGGLSVFAYYFDVIFVKKQDVPVPTPSV